MIQTRVSEIITQNLEKQICHFANSLCLDLLYSLDTFIPNLIDLLFVFILSSLMQQQAAACFRDG